MYSTKQSHDCCNDLILRGEIKFVVKKLLLDKRKNLKW